ncbi:hypothetical protein BG28_14325 [Nesterenkonia sp. AN1]|uniref:Uncharacterized protein n=1 Tax=Nesterenkonia aurantiaca TaxID=1436010 RepID=A0A4V3ECB6_9MICC|nr:hypothetical protein [Nesterenkonia]EXF25267.1 hypothetical protein BG28_14325 [Nesterenkonia sp. AN1]TDS85732.1 hypothetical protein EV640_10573 [Nesterenkonia aurantiaca]
MTQDNDDQPDWFDDSKSYEELRIAKKQSRKRELDLENALVELQDLSPSSLESIYDVLDQHEALHVHWLRCVENVEYWKNDEVELRERHHPDMTTEEKSQWNKVYVQFEEALQRVDKYQTLLVQKSDALKARRDQLHRR